MKTEETTLSKVIGASLVITGLCIAYKNYKKEGFWSAVLATSLVGGLMTIKMYK
jgi:uncharacterized membrane-anchored protein